MLFHVFSFTDTVFDEKPVDKSGQSKKLNLNTLLSEEEDDEKANDEGTNLSFEGSDESFRNTFDDEDDDDNNQLTNSNDDKNFYRDFTLKFNSAKQAQDTASNNSGTRIQNYKLFQDNDCDSLKAQRKQQKQVNLTCFISSIEFHLSLLSIIQKISVYINENVTTSQLVESQAIDKSHYFGELMQLFIHTYTSSVRLERKLSFKILLSKIFYLNYESCLANFASLTKISFLSIHYLYFEHFIGECAHFTEDSNEEFDFSSVDDTKLLVALETRLK